MNISIGLSRNDSWISKAIVWFGKRKTGSATYSHAFLKIDDLVIEETFLGLRIAPYSKYQKIKHTLYTLKGMSAVQKINIRNEAMKQVGTYKGIYGYTKLPLFALDAIFKTYFFTKNLGVKSFKVCSQWVCWVHYKKAQYDDFSNWRSMAPDDIDDHCINNEKWEKTKEV